MADTTTLPRTAPAPEAAPRARSAGALRLDALERRFGAFTALRGIDLAAEPGEFVALLGPSGCGKTTALNCIAGLLAPTGGTITLGTKRIDTLPPEARGFGMVFQSYALFPHMSVRRNVGFGLAMQRVPRAEADRRIDEALALVRLSQMADRLPGQLSGGQQQRVAIARAIVIRPPVVLMDEPLSNLDAKLRLEMRAEIRRIHDAIGSTTVYVTHDQDEAMSLADRVVVMRDGLIRQVGSPESLYERPEHPDVAEFMGFRSRIDGRVVAVEGGRATVEGAGGRLEAIPRARVAAGQPVTLMIRPEDFTAGPDGIPAQLGVPATVGSFEYRGRAFFGTANTEAGELYFRTDRRPEHGERVRLSAPPERVLVFPAEPA